MLTPQQTAELQRIKQWFPHRIVFGVIDKDTREFAVWATPTMHAAKRLACEGHTVLMVDNQLAWD